MTLFSHFNPPRARSIVVALGFLVTGTASAASIQTLAEAHWEGINVSDPQGPASTGQLLSSVGPNGTHANALQNVNGLAAVAVDGAAVNGQPGNTLLARSIWSETFTNTSGVAQSYEAVLSIPQIALFISNGRTKAPAPTTNQLMAHYAITLDINGNTAFSSTALLHSGDPAHVLVKTGTDLGGVKDPNSIKYIFAPFGGTANLGSFAPNASFTATYAIESGIDIPGFEVSASVAIGDPLAIQGTGIMIQPSAVPVPGAAGLLLSGVASLVAARRRRRLG